MRKAILGLPWILIVFTFVIVSVFITVFSFRYRITAEVQFEHGYDNTQLALLTFLSSTYNNKKVSEILAEHVSVNTPLNKKFLEDRLNKLIKDEKEDCYQFNITEKVPIGSDCAYKYLANAKIPLPYNPEKLVVDSILVVK